MLLALIFLSAALTAREYRIKASQSWVSAGISGLGQRIQGDHRLEDIGQLALEYLATYLKAHVGAGYVADCNGGFSLFGGYALPRERLAEKLLRDEGWWGRLRARASCCMCAMCRRTICPCRPAPDRPSRLNCWWRLRWKTARCLLSSSWASTAR